MKKTLIATLVLIISAVATANAAERKGESLSTSNNISISTNFTKLVVDGNVDVVLFEDNSLLEIRTFGKSQDMAATSITEKDGVLHITNKRRTGEKVLIYVPVRLLKSIEADNNAKVSTATPLLSEHITLYANGDCKFNVTSTGTIDVVENNGSEVVMDAKIIKQQ